MPPRIQNMCRHAKAPPCSFAALTRRSLRRVCRLPCGNTQFHSNPCQCPCPAGIEPPCMHNNTSQQSHSNHGPVTSKGQAHNCSSKDHIASRLSLHSSKASLMMYRLGHNIAMMCRTAQSRSMRHMGTCSASTPSVHSWMSSFKAM